MVKLFDLDMGGDLRCIVMDGHRPVHLANVHSRYNVAVLGEEQAQDEAISSGSEYSDNDSDSGDEVCADQTLQTKPTSLTLLCCLSVRATANTVINASL